MRSVRLKFSTFGFGPWALATERYTEAKGKTRDYMSEAITNGDTYIYIDSEAVMTFFELSIRPVLSS